MIVKGDSQVKSSFVFTELYGIDEGLGHGVIMHMQTDKNGYLWVHSMNKLQLFDGEEFTDMTSQVKNFEGYGNFSFGKMDELYFLTNQSLTKLNTTTYTFENTLTLPLSNTGQSQQSEILSEDSTFLYIYTANDTLYKINREQLKIEEAIPFKKPTGPIYSPNDIGEIPKLARSIEFLSINGQLYSFDLNNRDTIKLNYHNASTFLIIRPEEYAFQSGSQFFLLQNDQLDSFQMPGISGMMTNNFISIHHEKNICVATREFIYQFDINTREWSRRYEDIEKKKIYSMGLRYCKIDDLNNIFIADFNRGLLKLSPIQDGFHYFGSGEMEVFTKTISVSEKLNRVLLGTLQSGLLVYDTSGNLLEQFNSNTGYPELNRILLVAKIEEDRFLICTDFNSYEFRLTGDNQKIKKVPMPDNEVADYYAHQIPSNDPAYIYLSMGYANLMVNKSGPPTIKAFPKVRKETTSTISTPQGYIQIQGKELVHYNKDLSEEIKRIQIKDLGQLRCMIQYNQDQFLLGCNFGLYILEINTGQIVKRLFDKLVYAILPGNKPGEFWFSTDYGLFKIDNYLSLTNYTKESGLQDNEFNTNAAYRTAKGKLYFAGVNGVTSFYPEKVENESNGITSIVKYITAGDRTLGRYQNFTQPQEYVLGYNENTINIGLLGRGSKSPSNYNYQYYVKGVNDGWIDMGRNKNITLQLPSGTYRFYYEVNNGFNKNAIPESYFTLIIRPPFYLRTWFVLSLILLAVGIIAYFYRQQLAKRKMQLEFDNELKEKMQSDRMRISRELHDNIGAQMATVKRSLNFLGAHFDEMPKDKIETKLQDIENISSKINQELRDTIWATQHENISIADFIGRIKSFVFQHFPQEGNVRVFYEEKCEKQVKLSPFIALNLQRICQEALNNILKHSNAGEVCIRFIGNQNKFMICIEDDGKGFDPEHIQPGYGLDNMNHRASQIGAKITIGRGESKGTHIQIHLDPIQTITPV